MYTVICKQIFQIIDSGLLHLKKWKYAFFNTFLTKLKKFGKNPYFFPYTIAQDLWYLENVTVTIGYDPCRDVFMNCLGLTSVLNYKKKLNWKLLIILNVCRKMEYW